mmetsp:Transcript_95589/g.298685  ORF Transcript_95589/g.298685 Transcript_95589/m.298685 type:complete len:194 (+) Transcript_95589:524-1105(+)
MAEQPHSLKSDDMAQCSPVALPTDKPHSLKSNDMAHCTAARGSRAAGPGSKLKRKMDKEIEGEKMDEPHSPEPNDEAQCGFQPVPLITGENVAAPPSALFDHSNHDRCPEHASTHVSDAVVIQVLRVVHSSVVRSSLLRCQLSDVCEACVFPRAVVRQALQLLCKDGVLLEVHSVKHRYFKMASTLPSVQSVA